METSSTSNLCHPVKRSHNIANTVAMQEMDDSRTHPSSSSSRIRVLATLSDPSIIFCVSLSPNGRVIAVSLSDGRVMLLDAATGAQRVELSSPIGDICRIIIWSPCGHLLTFSFHCRIMRQWDVETGECVRVLDGHSSMYCVAFAPCGCLLAAGSGDHTVRLWHAADGSRGPVLCGHDSAVNGVAFSADGALLASASDDCTVRLWHMPDGAPGHVLRGHTSWVESVAFSPVCGSYLLASGSDDETVRLWDAEAGTLVRELRGHDSTVFSLAWTLDGRQLTTSSEDSTTARLWCVTNGALLNTLHGHTGHVRSVTFSPSGRHVASCSDDGTVRLWTVCPWTDRTHHLFAPEFKARVFYLMCVREKLQHSRALPCLPMEMWLEIFSHLCV